jgi:hypothetical protein
MLPELVRGRLERLGVPADFINPELDAMSPVTVAPTASRALLGSLVEYAKEVPYYLPIGGWDLADLPAIEEKLAERPCRCGNRFTVIFPNQSAQDLLFARWKAHVFEMNSRPTARILKLHR